MIKLGLVKLCWLAVMGILAALATEAFTRVLLPQNRDTIMDILVADETVGYIYEPGASTRERAHEYDVAFEINSLGLRDREYKIEDESAYRVLLLGNSFCVSHGVEIEGSMSRALERELQLAFATVDVPRRVQVINASNAGYNAFNYWKSYERWAPIFRPDAVVVGFVPTLEHLCSPEDIRYVIRDGQMVARYREGEIPVIPRPNTLRRIRKYLAYNSDLYVLLRNFFYYNERIQKLLGSGDRALGNTSRLVDPFRVEVPPRIDEGRTRALKFLSRLNEITARDGVPLLVIAIPQKAEVLDSAWAAAQRRADELGAEIDRSLPRRLLKEHSIDQLISMIDATPALKSLGAEGYFQHDNHWNEVGIAAVAAMVAPRWGELVGWPRREEEEPDAFDALPARTKR